MIGCERLTGAGGFEKRKEVGETRDEGWRTVETLRRSMMKESPAKWRIAMGDYILFTMYNLNILCTLQNNQLYSLYLYYNSFVQYAYIDIFFYIIYCNIITILSLPSYTIQLRYYPWQNSLCGMTAAYIRRVRLDRSKQNSFISHATNINNPNGHAPFVCSFH